MQSIRQKKEFDFVFCNGRKIDGRLFKLFWENTSPNFSLGQVISKKVGGAVARNKLRRRVRYFFSTQKELPKGRLVLLARAGRDFSDWRQIESELSDLTKKL